MGVLGVEDLVDGRIGMRSSIYALRGSVRIAEHWGGGSDPNPTVPRYATASIGPYLGQRARLGAWRPLAGALAPIHAIQSTSWFSAC